MSELLTKKVLVLGSRWSGKSLLIKRLEDLSVSPKSANDEFAHTTATVGKTLTVIPYKRNHTLELHELGGTLSCLWESFYKRTDFDKIVYVVDATQPWSMAFSLEQLKEIAELTAIKPKNMLIVVNKANEINALTKSALTELLDLNTIWKGEVDVLETNARAGTNVPAVLDWLTR